MKLPLLSIKIQPLNTFVYDCEVEKKEKS